MPPCRFDYRPYQRPFAQTLNTHHGPWALREGLLVRLSQGDRQGYGEIAPLPWFGSETLGQALALCRALPRLVTDQDIQAIPPGYPACRFGLASAWEVLHSIGDISDMPAPPLRPQPHNTAHLLPTGDAALTAWARPWQQGYQTFKWKIGAAPLAQEIAVFEQLVAALPIGAALRLDANGGLTLPEAKTWLAQCDRSGVRIDCLEQPLPAGQFATMLALQDRYRTPLGIDESVATVPQLMDCLQQGWRGPVVVKAAIAGFPSQLRQVCRQHQADVIWSSVFETAVGRGYVFGHLVPQPPEAPQRAFGYGTQHWFNDGWDALSAPQLWSRL